MSPTRRLAAIMAADVAEYSAAMERDEEGTFEAVTALLHDVIEPQLAQHQGRLIKTTGDGFLAEFASPLAAIKCALAIQNRPAGDGAVLELRIGLNLGDVIVEASGDVYGEEVNVAARLEGLAEPGGILVSDKIFREIEGKVEATLEDCGDQQVKNISRPVRVYAVRIPSRAAASRAGANRFFALPDKPSIAVLPFQNMSGDPEQEYFADGIVEDIITALSRFRSLFVIARNSSFAYKGKAVDIKRVGRELTVRYVLEGSVRKVGGRLRISGQLIEAPTNLHLWADKFDGTEEDVFDLQDRVTASVAAAIVPTVEQAEIKRAVNKSTDLVAYDYYLRGLASYHKRTRDNNRQAVELLTRATELDETFAAAFIWLVACFNQRTQHGWIVDRKHESTEALRLARHALELAKDDPWVLAVSAAAFLIAGDETAAPLAERAVQLNPNLAFGWSVSGWTKLAAGDPEAAIEQHGKALQLSPIDPLTFTMMYGLTAGHFFAGRYADARMWAERALAENPDYVAALKYLAAIFALTDEPIRAREIKDRVLRIDPTQAISRSNTLGFLRLEEHRQKLTEAFRLAGFPE